MKELVRIVLMVWMSTLAFQKGYGQGAFQLIAFEGPPTLAPGSAVSVQNYFEAGFSFQPIGAVGPGNTFGRVAPGGPAFQPENGTAYVQTALGHSLGFSYTNGVLFNLLSVDLAEYSTVVPDARTVQFIGYYMDGSTVQQGFTTDGIIDGTGPLADFQNFTFSAAWSGLSRVEVPGFGWSMDNVRVSTGVPEPTSGVLILLGGVSLWLIQARRKRRSQISRS